MMTPEEAIVWLEDDIKEINRDLEDDKISNVYAEEGTEVYKMAISAIKRLKQYHEIGTVEECRETVEKTKAKKCVQDTRPDHTHYKCPTCGKIQMSEYKRGIRILGRITNFCDNCGQRLESEK